MKNRILLLAIVLTIASPAFSNVQSAKVSKTKEVVSPVSEQELTIGTVQKHIRAGMAQDEVALTLGSPNIVTQDANGKETWIYDKISSSITDRNKSESYVENAMSTRYLWHDILTLATLGLINKNVKPELKDVSQVVSTQKTLTIIIKFDKNNLVESYSYHSSKF